MTFEDYDDNADNTEWNIPMQNGIQNSRQPR